MKAMIFAVMMLVAATTHAQTSSSSSSSYSSSFEQNEANIQINTTTYSVVMFEKINNGITLVTVGVPSSSWSCGKRVIELAKVLGFDTTKGVHGTQDDDVMPGIHGVACLDLGLSATDTSVHVYGPVAPVADGKSTPPPYGTFTPFGFGGMPANWDLSSIQSNGSPAVVIPNFHSHQACEDAIGVYKPYTKAKLICIRK